MIIQPLADLPNKETITLEFHYQGMLQEAQNNGMQIQIILTGEDEIERFGKRVIGDQVFEEMHYPKHCWNVI